MISESETIDQNNAGALALTAGLSTPGSEWDEPHDEVRRFISTQRLVCSPDGDRKFARGNGFGFRALRYEFDETVRPRPFQLQMPTECLTLTGPDTDAPAIHSLRVGCLMQRAQLPPKKRTWCRSALGWSEDVGSVPATD